MYQPIHSKVFISLVSLTTFCSTFTLQRGVFDTLYLRLHLFDSLDALAKIYLLCHEFSQLPRCQTVPPFQTSKALFKGRHYSITCPDLFSIKASTSFFCEDLGFCCSPFADSEVCRGSFTS